MTEDVQTLIGTRARVHYNLHKGGFSITVNGLVVANVADVTLADVVFKVSAAGRDRSHRLGKRTVHAWVIGVVDTINTSPDLADLERVSYNPAADRAPTFATEDEAPVLHAAHAVFANDPTRPSRGYAWI